MNVAGFLIHSGGIRDKSAESMSSVVYAALSMRFLRTP